MSFFPGNDPEPGDAFACDAIELMVIPNAKDIGGMGETSLLVPTPDNRSEPRNRRVELTVR